LVLLLNYPRRDLTSGVEAKLGKNMFDVALSGTLRDHQFGGDCPVGHPFRNQVRDLPFSSCQRRVRTCEALVGRLSLAESEGNSVGEARIRSIGIRCLESSIAECTSCLLLAARVVWEKLWGDDACSADHTRRSKEDRRSASVSLPPRDPR
jgi:hypothetical protein